MGLLPEAEYAFCQALRRCPQSPEACFRLSDLYMDQHRYDAARQRITGYLEYDPKNLMARSFLDQISTQESLGRRREIEKMDPSARKTAE
jgi:Tfp pilus assembly protein PilF